MSVNSATAAMHTANLSYNIRLILLCTITSACFHLILPSFWETVAFTILVMLQCNVQSVREGRVFVTSRIWCETPVMYSVTVLLHHITPLPQRSTTVGTYLVLRYDCSIINVYFWMLILYLTLPFSLWLLFSPIILKRSPSGNWIPCPLCLMLYLAHLGASVATYREKNLPTVSSRLFLRPTIKLTNLHTNLWQNVINSIMEETQIKLYITYSLKWFC